MSNEGFSTVLVIVLVIILATGLLIGVTTISRVNQEKSIERQINSLNISAPINSKQCSAGSIDAAPYCRYVYDDNGNDVVAALKNTGYTSNQPMTVDGNITEISFNGGNSNLSIEITIYNGKTTLDAQRPH